MLQKPIFFLLHLVIASSATSQNKIRIELVSLPTDHPSVAEVFIAGSFNRWIF